MEVAGLRPVDLAETCGVSRQYINLILTGKRDGGGYWPKLADVLKVNVEWLTSGLKPPAWAEQPSDDLSQLQQQSITTGVDDDKLLSEVRSNTDRLERMEKSIERLVALAEAQEAKKHRKPDKWDTDVLRRKEKEKVHG